MIKFLSLFLLCAISSVDPAPAANLQSQTSFIQPKNIGLFFGASQYHHFCTLKNPSNDALDMAALFSDSGYRVQTWIDPTYQDMCRAEDSLRKMIKGATKLVIFFSGHAIEVTGENYMLPIDADNSSAKKLYKKVYNIKKLLKLIDSANIPISIVLFDGCRTPPPDDVLDYFSRWQGQGNFYPHSNTFLGFASLPNQNSYGAPGRNSVYTGQLLKYLRMGLPIDGMFNRISMHVRNNT